MKDVVYNRGLKWGPTDPAWVKVAARQSVPIRQYSVRGLRWRGYHAVEQYSALQHTALQRSTLYSALHPPSASVCPTETRVTPWVPRVNPTYQSDRSSMSVSIDLL